MHLGSLDSGFGSYIISHPPYCIVQSNETGDSLSDIPLHVLRQLIKSSHRLSSRLIDITLHSRAPTPSFRIPDIQHIDQIPITLHHLRSVNEWTPRCAIHIPTWVNIIFRWWGLGDIVGTDGGLSTDSESECVVHK